MPADFLAAHSSNGTVFRNSAYRMLCIEAASPILQLDTFGAPMGNSNSISQSTYDKSTLLRSHKDTESRVSTSGSEAVAPKAGVVNEAFEDLTSITREKSTDHVRADFAPVAHANSTVFKREKKELKKHFPLYRFVAGVASSLHESQRAKNEEKRAKKNALLLDMLLH